MWNIIIDVVLVLIIVGCAIAGIVKGFFDSILGLISTGLALALSVFLAKYVANFINKIFDFETFVMNKLGDDFKIFGMSFNKSDVAKFVVWILSLVIVFIVIKLVILILSKVFSSITKNSPTISGLNRVLGMVFGLVRGCVIVVAGLAVCSLLAGTSFGRPISDKIADTKITNGVFKFVDEFVQKNINADTIKDIIDRIEGDSKNETNDDSTGTSGTSGEAGKVSLIDMESNTIVIEI